MLDNFYQPEIVNNVVRVDIGADGDFYEVRYSKDKSFQAAVGRLQKTHRRMINKDDPEGKLNQELLAPLVAKDLLVNWRITISKEALERNLPEVKGKEVKGKDGVFEIPFGVENCTKVLSAFCYQPLFFDIYGSAMDRTNFVKENREDDRKN